MGELRFYLNCGTPFATITGGVVFGIARIMRERARRRMAQSWQGLLVHATYGVWIVAVGVRAEWAGWPMMINK